MAAGFFDSLTGAATDQLREMASARQWAAGEILFREGDVTDHVVVLERGIVKAVAVSETGIEIVLAVRGPGDILGELSAIRGDPRTATVVAVADVEALVLGANDFRALLAAPNGAALALLTVLSDRVSEAGRRHVEFGSTDTTLRLARLLAELGRAYGTRAADGVHLTMLSQDELAGLCAASREAVARGLRTLRDAGLVSTGRRRVVIADLDVLADWMPA